MLVVVLAGGAVLAGVAGDTENWLHDRVALVVVVYLIIAVDVLMLVGEARVTYRHVRGRGPSAAARRRGARRWR